MESTNNWGTAITLTKQTIDTSPPTTTATLSPAANVNGWNNTSVNVSLSARDSGEGFFLNTDTQGSANGATLQLGKVRVKRLLVVARQCPTSAAST